MILVKENGHANGYSFCSGELDCFVRAEHNLFDSGGNSLLQTENAVFEFHLRIKPFGYSETPNSSKTKKVLRKDACLVGQLRV